MYLKLNKILDKEQLSGIKRQTNNEQNSAEPKQEHQKLFLKLPTHAKLPK